VSVNQKLQEAELAYHQLQTGTMVVSVKKDGREVEFNRANIHRLKAYIDTLRLEAGVGANNRRRPAGVFV